MLLRGLSWLIGFQLLGTALNVLFFPVIPGPIIGLVLFFIYLLVRGNVSAPIDEAAASLLRYLPLLLVPPAIGVMAHVDDIQADFWAIAGSLVVSLVISMVVVGWLMQLLISRQARKKGEQ